MQAFFLMLLPMSFQKVAQFEIRYHFVQQELLSCGSEALTDIVIRTAQFSMVLAIRQSMLCLRKLLDPYIIAFLACFHSSWQAIGLTNSYSPQHVLAWLHNPLFT